MTPHEKNPDQAPPQAAEREGMDRCGYTECAALGRTVCEDCRALAPSPTGTEASRGVGAIPAGWVLVPEKATGPMWAAFRNEDATGATFHRGYRAMLAATPTPPVSPPDSTGQGEATYYPADLKGADLLGWIVGYYGTQMPKGLAGKLLVLMNEWYDERSATPSQADAQTQEGGR